MPVKRKSSTAAVMRAIRQLEKSSVLIGIAADTGGPPGVGINYAALGYLFETGAPETNMPPRPWLRPGVESILDPATKILKATADKVLRGAAAATEGSGYDARPVAENALHRIGLIGQSAIQARIQAGIAPPLSERTVYARLHRRRNRRSPGSMTPLVDTGGFLKSIRYIVKV